MTETEEMLRREHSMQLDEIGAAIMELDGHGWCTVTDRACVDEIKRRIVLLRGAAATAPSAPLKRGDPECGRTADEPHRPLVCFVCAKHIPISFNFCCEHKDEYERLKKSAPTATDWMRQACKEIFAMVGYHFKDQAESLQIGTQIIAKYAGEHAGAESKKEPTV